MYMYTFTKFDTPSCHGLHMIMFVSRVCLVKKSPSKKCRVFNDR